MRKVMKTERGQALILIAVGIAVLLGMTALAIDGGNAFADRRHAQNAADNAALAGALAKVTNPDKNPTEKWEIVQTAALNIAASNTYTNDGERSVVSVHIPPIEGPYSCENQPDICNDYLQVIIVSNIDTWFAQIVGVEMMTNRVSAVAKAKDQDISQMFFGNAFVSLMPGCKPGGYPNDPFTIGGNATNIVSGSGLWVNSSCSPALKQSGTSSMTVNDYGITVIGGCTYSSDKVDPDPSCNANVTQIPYPPTYMLPDNPSCPTNGSFTSNGNVHTFNPGNYTGTFPPVNGGTIILRKGIYCLDRFRLNGQYTITTDVNGNGVHDDDEGVLFFAQQEVTFNGQSTLNVHAMSDGEYANLLIYMPLTDPTPNNNVTITITGGAGSTFTGSMLNPSGHCTVQGSGESFALRSQVVCYSISTAGGGSVNVFYDEGENYQAVTPPNIEISN
jgi:hypothetical protein